MDRAGRMTGTRGPAASSIPFTIEQETPSLKRVLRPGIERSSCLLIGVGMAFVLAIPCLAQQRVPLADPTDMALLPSGISDQPVHLEGSLVSIFKDEDGTDALSFLGEFSARIGEKDPQELRSREAVVWIENRTFEGRAYRHVQLLLWRDAEINEMAGTTTNGPALFVTLNTFASVTTHADDVTRQSAVDTDLYRQGRTLRKAYLERKSPAEDAKVSLGVFDPSGATRSAGPPKPKPVIHFQSRGEVAISKSDDGGQIITMVGGVYLSRGVAGTEEFLELQADNVVVFLAPGAEVGKGIAGGAAGLGGDGAVRNESAKRDDDRQRQVMATGFGNVSVEAAYLEGDVQLVQGANAVRASKLYFDLINDRALILDAVVRTTLVDRGIPLYIRAAEIRQLSAREFSATDAKVTTSEFHTPHYHVGARRVELINRTPSEPDGKSTGIKAGTFRIQDATLNVGGRPLAYWPYIRGNVDSSETAIRSLRTGYSDDFGLELETKWNLFSLLGWETPEGFDSTLSLDSFSERGPAVGVDADYQRDRYFGMVRSYMMTDDGVDNLGRDREGSAEHDVRGRLLLRHRQYLEEDWQLTLEFSYLSERNFLEEFFEKEFDTEKEQETLLYLKRQRDNWAFTAALQARILDFYTQTERLPDFSFHLSGESLGGAATWYSENRAGLVRLRGADQTFRELLLNGHTHSSGTTARADTRQEVTSPIDVGDLRLAPFVVGRGTTWDDSPAEGGLSRGYGAAGVRGSMYFWKVYPEVNSELFDVHGLRHVIKPDFTVWGSEANHERDELFPFDKTVEGISVADGATFGVRQRWQTRRGSGDTRRVVDVLTHDLEVGVFNDVGDDSATTNGFGSFTRPENSITRNYVNSSTIWRVNDRTAILSETNYDLNDGEIDVLNVSVSVERSPRFSYLVGYRFIDPTNSNLLGFDLNYKLTEKHTLAVRELFDLDRGATLDFTIALVRRFPRWFGAISFELDEAEDDFGVSFSLWPEGLPNAALGSRRFTGLANTTRLRNE